MGNCWSQKGGSYETVNNHQTQHIEEGHQEERGQQESGQQERGQEKGRHEEAGQDEAGQEKGHQEERVQKEGGQEELIQEESLKSRPLHSQPNDPEKKEVVGESVHSNSASGSADFPFLTDADTINFISHSHTLFIMRGVSGSGKSHLVKLLLSTYSSAKACSADNFFFDHEGIYRFDKTKLSQTHEACQEAAKTLCEKNTSVIIIDNTNIQKWSMGFYVDLANRLFNYHVILVEPRTPWKDDAAILAQRSTHGVDEEIISQKLKQLKKEKYTPAFYAWFINKVGSQSLYDQGLSRFNECLSVFPGAIVDFSFDPNSSVVDSGTSYFKMKNGTLHCTARFNRRGEETTDYENMEIVKQSLGKCFTLRIIGFTFTPRTMGARVKLDDREQRLFDRVEEEKVIDGGNIYYKGFSAHVTLATAKDVEAKVTGEDIIEICRRKFENQVQESVDVDCGIFNCYGDGLYELCLRDPIELKSLFTGFYPKLGHSHRNA